MEHQPKGEKMIKTRESSSPTEQKTRVAKTQPTQEEVALRAYHIYLERGAVPGYELEDWMEAERQLVGGNGKSSESSNSNGHGANGKLRRKPRVKTAAA
jgi:hypothetical protein